MKQTTVVALRAAIFAALCAAPVGVAFAETAGEGDKLEEIIVTAEKHQESVQKTAISMSVLSAADIAQEDVHDVASLSQVDPSVSFTTAAGTGYSAIRGVTSTDLTEIGDPAVAVARDGFFSNRGYAMFSSFYDLDRIEVLKGPQGTLYGRNSTGGVINIITKRPGKEFGGQASIDAGSYHALNVEAALNLPLSDTLALRVSGVSRYHEGYRNNAPLDQKGDDENSRSYRAQLSYQPIEAVDLLFSMQQDDLKSVGDVSLALPLGSGIDQVTDARNFPNSMPSLQSLVSTRYRWEGNFHLPAALTLTYLGGIDDTEWRHATDATSNFPVNAQFIQFEHPRTSNHELRIASAQGGFFTWQAGLFYFHELNSPLDSGLVFPAWPGFLPPPVDGDYFIRFRYNVDTTSKAAFGQGAFKLGDTLKLSAGVRYTKDEKARTGDAVIIFGPTTTPGNGNMSNSKTTYHVGLDWTPTASNMVYAKYDTGYKSGGFNSNGQGPSVPYGPEDVKSIEVGTKNRFANDHIQLNAAAFHEVYSGYQGSQFTNALGGGVGVQNVGDARINGLEAEFIAQSQGAGRFNLSTVLLDSKFTSGTALDSNNQPVAMSGLYLPNAPRVSSTFGYEIALHGANGTWTPRLEGKYQGSYYYSFENYPDTQSSSNLTANAFLRYAPEASKWDVQLYVRNVTDKTTLTNAVHKSGFSANNQLEFAPPRTWGARFSVSW